MGGQSRGVGRTVFTVTKRPWCAKGVALRDATARSLPVNSINTMNYPPGGDSFMASRNRNRDSTFAIKIV